MRCPSCGGATDSSVYVDYCLNDECGWGYAYPSLWNGIGLDNADEDD